MYAGLLAYIFLWRCFNGDRRFAKHDREDMFTCAFKLICFNNTVVRRQVLEVSLSYFKKCMCTRAPWNWQTQNVHFVSLFSFFFTSTARNNNLMYNECRIKRHIWWIFVEKDDLPCIKLILTNWCNRSLTLPIAWNWLEIFHMPWKGRSVASIISVWGCADKVFQIVPLSMLNNNKI